MANEAGQGGGGGTGQGGQQTVPGPPPGYQIPLDSIVYTDEVTGAVWTYADVLEADAVNPLGFAPLPASIAWDDWQVIKHSIFDSLKFISQVPEEEKKSGGSGGSGGRAAPIFVPQDPDAIREQVTNYVVAVLGKKDAALIEAGVATYQKRERAGFNQRESQAVDPWQAVKAEVRQSRAYKAVNGQRPDSVDEMDYVTSKQAKFRQLGISDQRAQELGIEAAISGGGDEALVQQASIDEINTNGRVLAAQRNKLKSAASAAMGLVR